jgi:hypothetical protein
MKFCTSTYAIKIYRWWKLKETCTEHNHFTSIIDIFTKIKLNKVFKIIFRITINISTQ